MPFSLFARLRLAVLAKKKKELARMTETPNYHRIRQFGLIFIEFTMVTLFSQSPKKTVQLVMVIQGPFSAASFASLESKETTHVWLDALR